MYVFSVHNKIQNGPVNEFTYLDNMWIKIKSKCWIRCWQLTNLWQKSIENNEFWPLKIQWKVRPKATNSFHSFSSRIKRSWNIRTNTKFGDDRKFNCASRGFTATLWFILFCCHKLFSSHTIHKPIKNFG